MVDGQSSRDSLIAFQIGIMQGRLSPRHQGQYQAFPLHHWKKEFQLAKSIGFAAIEFIFDYRSAKQNPLMTDGGIKSILELIEETGVKVKSICADYFMERPFHSEHFETSLLVLKELIDRSSQLGVKDIVIPCVDQARIITKEDQCRVLSAIRTADSFASERGIYLNLETDLPPERVGELLTDAALDCLRINYDIGNSASLGYDPSQEFANYGEWISDVHVKDRVLGGFSVKLGIGNAKFDLVFSLLKQYNFKGNLVMQAARAEEYSDELSLVREQLALLQSLMKRYLV